MRGDRGSQGGAWVLVLAIGGCGAREPVGVVDAPAPAVAPGVDVPAVVASGANECEPLEIRCARAIASREEAGRTIVYLSEETKGGARPGQWVVCAHEDRKPSPPCEVLAIVDGGMLEASCGEATSCGR